MTSQQLVEENMNLVHHCIRKYYPTFVNDEDLVSIGMIGLCKAANGYDEEKGAFSSLACHCILNEFKMEFRRRMREIKPISLESTVESDEGEKSEFINALVGEEDVDYFDTEGWFAKLTPRQQEIIKLRSLGLKQWEIGEKLNLSRQVVNMEIRKARLLWRNHNS